MYPRDHQTKHCLQEQVWPVKQTRLAIICQIYPQGVKSSEYDADTTFQSQFMSSNHFLAGEIQPFMSCIGPIKVFQQVKMSEGVIICQI